MAIRCLTALLATALQLGGVRASDAVVRIVEDRGGRIETYVDKYQGVRSSGEMVIIDGFCASACTIVLGAVAHDKICVTSRAKLGFHAAWDPGSKGRKISNPEATLTLYSMYPSEVRRWIDQRGGLTPHMIFLGGRQLDDLRLVCQPGQRVSEDELKTFVKDRLAPYKYPRLIEFIAELPKTATGKIQRFRLREQDRA